MPIALWASSPSLPTLEASMKLFALIKSIPCTLIVGLLLLAYGCHSYHYVSIDSDEPQVSKAIVSTTDGKYYQLSYWELDKEGNITGIGVEFQSHSDWSRLERDTPFEGTIAFERVALMEAHEVNFLVETTDGKCYRVASWALDADGNLVCRGTVHKSRDHVDGGDPSEYFQGTLAAKDLKPVEIEQFSFPRTVLLVVGILGGTCAVLLLIFAASYEHG
jgi:hypothetical protein